MTETTAAERAYSPIQVDEDPESLPDPARRALATLLTNRFVTRAGHRACWDALLAYEDRLRVRLADLFLELVVDRDYEVAFKRQSDDPEAPVMLRRDRPLSREATLLLVHMRQLHAYTDSRDDPVLLTLDAIVSFLAQFRDPEDTDPAGFDKTVEATIKALSGVGLLTPDPDDDRMFIIAPAVVPLLSLERLGDLRDAYRALTDVDEVAEEPNEDEDVQTEGVLQR